MKRDGLGYFADSRHVNAVEDWPKVSCHSCWDRDVCHAELEVTKQLEVGLSGGAKPLVISVDILLRRLRGHFDVPTDDEGVAAIEHGSVNVSQLFAGAQDVWSDRVLEPGVEFYVLRHAMTDDLVENLGRHGQKSQFGCHDWWLVEVDHGERRLVVVVVCDGIHSSREVCRCLW